MLSQGFHFPNFDSEIKSAQNLLTSHVMQAAWYTELLEKVNQKNDQAFFFLKDGKRQTIELRTIRNEYENTRKEILKIKADNLGPGPHLISSCSSCHWRGICMPILEKGNIYVIT